jgi:hypothetical protein
MPLMWTIRTISMSGGSRSLAVRMMVGIARACFRGSTRTSICRPRRTASLQGIYNALFEVCGHVGQVEVDSAPASVAACRPACRLVAADAVLAAVSGASAWP